MNLSRNLIQGAAAGFLMAAILGLIEAAYLLITTGAPDLLSPFYAVVLYGLIGLALGIGGGIALSIIEKMGWLKGKDEAFAFAWGEAVAVSPLALFILMYLGNKVVYAEQGVPLTGKFTILAMVGGYALLTLVAGPPMLRGPFKFLLRGPGALGSWAVLALITGLVSLVGGGADPRADFASGNATPAGLSDAPNVLVIAVDTLRADYLGLYGKGGDPSPVLDALGADAVVFEQAYAAASWTRSSFASLWSSRIPSSHNAATKAARLPDEVELLSEVLMDAGVTTANLANNINVTSTFNFDQGYATFLYESPAYAFGATESVFGLTFYKVIHKLNEKLGGAKHVETFYQPAEVVLADAKAFIEANMSARWMLGTHLMEPHDPYFEHPYLEGKGAAEFNGVGFSRAEVESPDPTQSDYLKRVYLQEITHMDRKLGPFIAWLKAQGLYDDMMIVVTADHGEEFDEHGGFWHGTTLYDEQIHVPLIVKLPGNKLAGTRVAWQARTIDIAPTITAAMGITPSAQWEGSDLIGDVVRQEAERVAVAKAVADAEATVTAMSSVEPTVENANTLAGAQAVLERLMPDEDPCLVYRPDGERLVVAEQDFEGNVISAIRKTGFKYIRANTNNPRGLPTEALFDVVVDPGEQTNLLGADGNVCGRYYNGLPKALGGELKEIIVEATKRASSGGDAEVSDAEKAKLCALGYLSGPDCE